VTLPRQGGRDPSRPGACHRGHGCVPTGKPTQNILRANAPHTYRTRRTYTTHTLSCRLVGARAGLAPRRQAKWRGIRMNDSPLACLKGEPERAAPARARLCRPLRRPTAVGVGVGLARTSSNASGRSEARQRRSRAGRGRVVYGPRARVGPGHAAAAPGPGTQYGHGPMAQEWVTWHPSRPFAGHGTAPQSRSRNGRGPGAPGPARKGTVTPHPSQAPCGRGPAAPESTAPQSWSRRISDGLATVAVPSHPGRDRDGRGPGASESVAQTVAGAGVIRAAPARARRTAKPRTTRLR